ncbi:hypothetical protein F5Y16DRAFT_160896 [Xylariaceae sp. FL0255]|nr:hypothetical protein F5Y16DRAFT_160896 [Xylariaceae sp. FL0255]
MAEAAGLVLGAVTLSSLFEHMLMRVEPRYQEQEAYVLWLLYKHHTIPSPGPLPTVGLAAIDRLIAAGADVDMDIDVSVQKRTKCVVMEGRLRSRCCGLLEVVERRADHDMCFCDIELDTETGVQLHDTVVDSSVSFDTQKRLRIFATARRPKPGMLEVQKEHTPRTDRSTVAHVSTIIEDDYKGIA